MFDGDIIYENLKQVDYQVIKQIEEHAKKYEQVSDKKEFLKNVSAYEQKLILLNSLRPYDVLNYLDELDLKSSKLIINCLSYEEISKILELFTSEDKKSFYNSFSDLSLVNEFIKYDNNSSEYVKSLPFERKVDILESSKKETIESSSIIYESMSFDEKTKAVDSITSVEASSVMNEILDDGENIQTETLEQTAEKVDNMEELKEQINNVEELLENNIKELENQNENNKLEENQNLDENNIMKEKNNEKESIEENKNKKEDDLNLEKVKVEAKKEDVDELEKYSIIGNGESYASIVFNPMISDKFQQVKDTKEKQEIEILKTKYKNTIENEDKINYKL